MTRSSYSTCGSSAATNLSQPPASGCQSPVTKCSSATATKTPHGSTGSRYTSSPLVHDGVLDLWSDRRIELGDDWRKEIAAALSRARAALLLISADFLDSDFIRYHELPPLLEAAQNEGCRIIPILVRPSLFEQVPSLARFQHANPNGATLSEMPEERTERLIADIAQWLSKLFQTPSGPEF